MRPTLPPLPAIDRREVTLQPMRELLRGERHPLKERVEGGGVWRHRLGMFLAFCFVGGRLSSANRPIVGVPKVVLGVWPTALLRFTRQALLKLRAATEA